MEIYIEYAFLENFLFDGVLLTLALTAAQVKRRTGKILLSALLGAVFAIVFPLLRLSKPLGTLLKILVGFLLVMLAFERLKTEKEWGRYALSAILFFAFSFGFGGSLLGVYSGFSQGDENLFSTERVPSLFVFFAFALLTGLSLWLIKRLYARRKSQQSVVLCRISSGGKRLETNGFADSGNLAEKNGLPVCFLAPDTAYELLGEKLLDGTDEKMKISTMAGERTVSLFLGAVEIKGEAGKKQVYFAPSANMIGREYKVLLHAGIGERYGLDRTG